MEELDLKEIFDLFISKISCRLLAPMTIPSPILALNMMAAIME